MAVMGQPIITSLGEKVKTYEFTQQYLVADGLRHVVVLDDAVVRVEEAGGANAGDLLRHLRRPLHRVERPRGKVDDAAGGAGNQADHALPYALKETTDPFVHSALHRLRRGEKIA